MALTDHVQLRAQGLADRIRASGTAIPLARLTRAQAALELLFDHRQGDDGTRAPWAPRAFWAEAAAALYGEDDPRTVALRTVALRTAGETP